MNEHEKVGANVPRKSPNRAKPKSLRSFLLNGFPRPLVLDTHANFAALGRPQDIAAPIVEDLPVGAHPERPWGHGDNPKTVVWKYLETHLEFEIDDSMDSKLLISVAPRGFLRRKM